MESGSILDSQLSASSSYASSVRPAMGRLNGVDEGGAWCPSGQVGGPRVKEEWLEIDLGRFVLLTAVSLQGRWDNGHGQEFTPSVRIVTDEFVSDVITANNKDTYNVVKITFERPVRTSKVRLVPHSDHQRTVCLRTELYGCEIEKDTNNVWGLIPIFIGISITFVIMFIVLTTVIFKSIKRRQTSNNASDIKTTQYYHQNLLLDISEPIYDEPLPTRTLNNIVISKPMEKHSVYSVPFTSGSPWLDSSSMRSTSTISESSSKSSSDSFTSIKLLPVSETLVTFPTTSSFSGHLNVC